MKQFDNAGVQHFSSKMYIGDYQSLDNARLLIDRKANIAEVAQNATVGHERFKNELLRLDSINGKMYILIEQDRIDRKPITQLEDVINWKPKYGVVKGDRIYRIMRAWKNCHNIEYVFCAKKDTGNKIIELLKNEKGQVNDK